MDLSANLLKLSLLFSDVLLKHFIDLRLLKNYVNLLLQVYAFLNLTQRCYEYLMISWEKIRLQNILL